MAAVDFESLQKLWRLRSKKENLHYYEMKSMSVNFCVTTDKSQVYTDSGFLIYKIRNLHCIILS